MKQGPGPRAEFTLGILGLSRVQRATVLSVCNLSSGRPRGYTVVPPTLVQEADILLVDGDDDKAIDRWEQLSGHMPAIIISAGGTGTNGARYSLTRAALPSRLMRMLDDVTIQELKYVPELVVGGDTEAPRPVAREMTARHRFGPRALVVDDSYAVRKQMQICMDLYGMAVDFAETAEDGLEKIRSRPYDIVFMDVILPGIDGYQACKKIKADRQTRGIPVVMLTGKGTAFDRLRGTMAGCNRYLTKPVQAEDLHTVLQSFVREFA